MGLFSDIYLDEPDQDPGLPPLSIGILPTESNQEVNICETIDPCPNPPCAHALIEPVKDQFFTMQADWKSKNEDFPNTLDNNEKIALGHQISQLRLGMDRAGRTILHNFQLDTTAIQIDSILTWMANLETFTSDYHLARHHFFNGNFTTSDAILAQIPVNYDLDGDMQVIYDNILAIFDTLQPYIAANEPLNALPPGLLVALETFKNNCDESGYLARELLYQNNIATFLECDPLPPAPPTVKIVDSQSSKSSKVIISPNPASQQIVIRSNTSPISAVQLVSSSGRLQSSTGILKSGFEQVVSINTLPPGLYFVKIQLASGLIENHKLIINH